MVHALITYVQSSHPHVVAAEPGQGLIFGLSTDLLTKVGLALIPVILFLWWEFRGRRRRDRWPVAQILYNEVQSNYQALQTRFNDALAASRQPQDIINMETLEFKDAALISLRERIDVLPRPVARQVLDLYSSFQRLRDLQLTLRGLPKAVSSGQARPTALASDRRYERVSIDLFRCSRTTLDSSREVVVHLYYVARIQEDLVRALRDPTPRAGWNGPGERRENRVILTRLPLWAYPIVKRWRRRRLPSPQNAYPS